MESETLYDTWERFKDLLRMCPHYGLPVWLQVQTFYTGLNQTTRQMLEASNRGALNTKTLKAAMKLFQEMTMNSYQWHNSRAKSSKPAHVYDIDAVIALAV